MYRNSVFGKKRSCSKLLQWQIYDLATGKREKALEYREHECAMPLSTKTARKHFHRV